MEKYPNDQTDSRIERRKVPGQKEAEVKCDGCAAQNRQPWHSFRRFLYRQQWHADYILECTERWSREHDVPRSKAEQIFRSRVAGRNGRKEQFDMVARDLRLDPLRDRASVKAEYDRRFPPRSKAAVRAKHEQGKRDNAALREMEVDSQETT